MGKYLVVLALVLAGCQTVRTTQPGVVGVEREQMMLVSSASINRSAEQAYSRVLSEAQRKGQLNRDAVQLERVRAIAHRLIPQTGAFRSDAPGWKWEVNLISAKEANAWCMPGGKIAFYTGLLERLRLSDDEIAAVMGHEIAHALREHARERASQAMAQGIGVAVIAAATRAPGAAMDLTQLVLDVTFNLPNSRTDEIEADRIGVELAARGAYDPRAAVTLWEKMQKPDGGQPPQSGGSQPPQFLSTHPAHENRIADLRVYSQRVMPLYEQARAPR
jgi:Zn-dependent protease with chaperone function